MPRRKIARIANPDRVKNICDKYKCDPFEEMIKLAMLEYEMPKAGMIEPAALEAMLQDYEIFEGEDGKRMRRLKAMNRFDIFKEAAQYVYPRLRSSETKHEEDLKLTIVLRTFNAHGIQLDTPVKTGITIPLEQPKELADGA